MSGAEEVPTGDIRVALNATAEYASYGVQPEQSCWAITSLKAPFYEPTSRAPVDIVAVVDKSGSMSGDKIKLVRETLLFVIEQCKLAVR
jgi:Mg-chelatase subunit ChlD